MNTCTQTSDLKARLQVNCPYNAFKTYLYYVCIMHYNQIFAVFKLGIEPVEGPDWRLQGDSLFVHVYVLRAMYLYI
jgi:hypothetical protein